MLKITKLLINLNIANRYGTKESYNKALLDFGVRAWMLAGSGNLYTKNTKGEIIRVDGKKETT